MENEDEKAVEPVSEQAAAPVEEEEITVGEVLDDLKYMEETAEGLFGGQDPSVCTYPEGYKPRQTVFACLTCTPEPQVAGVCYGCSLNCHDGHNIVELYTKRKFQCDCGNSKFGTKKCTLYEEKDAENKYNTYNHNYTGHFCTCNVFYPDDEAECELFQCEMCEDWFHENHIQLKHVDFEAQPTTGESGEEPANSTVTLEENKANSSVICLTCVQKYKFFLHITSGKEAICHSKLDSSDLVPTALVISKLRTRLCKCADCVCVYEAAGVEFLLDDEDDLATFEMESIKKAQESKATPEDEMRYIVSECGMEGAQKFYEGVNKMKRKFAEFTANIGDKPITPDDVKTLFAELSEERLQKRARRE